MDDTQIIDWLEKNMEEYLVLPPTRVNPYKDGQWSIYYKGHGFICSADNLRDVVHRAKELISG